MKILVQKFGGTSVSTEENRKRVIGKVKKAIKEGYCPVVVVSAMGRKGAPYATDTLLSLVGEKFKGMNPAAIDLLQSCGEIISSVVMSSELTKENIEAVPLTGGQAGIITDDNYNNAEILRVDTERLIALLAKGKVPIVAGFQGISEEGFITTIGRGGSDVTAAILGVALKAEEIQMYKDVDGIMTADPRIVSDASLIENISYDELFQFADQGAKVIHPKAVEIARKYNIPLVIKNTLNDCEGTFISNDAGNTGKVVAGITHVNGRVQINISDNGEEEYENILDILADNDISIDLINVFPKEKIFTIEDKDFDEFKCILNEVGLPYSCIENCSKIAIIGSKMKGMPGVMAKVLKALTRKHVEVLQTADSHNTIWCLVETANVKEAIRALHDEFNLK